MQQGKSLTEGILRGLFALKTGAGRSTGRTAELKVGFQALFSSVVLLPGRKQRIILKRKEEGLPWWSSG